MAVSHWFRWLLSISTFVAGPGFSPSGNSRVGPGVQYISDNQLYNSIITAHAIMMIFFMVRTSYLSQVTDDSCDAM